MRAGTYASVSAPAKLNLGLEILGKRHDGYHEIRTVMAMIDLVDSLTISTSELENGIRIAGVPGVASEDNLIAKAIHAFSEDSTISVGYDISVAKRIPSPGGLGGASSDAAAALRALNVLHENPLSADRICSIASGLGADVPFFLGPPVALASGTGTTLKDLPSVKGWVVLVVPLLAIRGKTATLYGALRSGDFSDGSQADTTAALISTGELPRPELLRNAFERPLYEIAPQLGVTRRGMLDAGAPFVAVSGAGPAHFTLLDTEAEARQLEARLKSTFPDGTLVTVARFLQTQPAVEVRDDEP